MASVSGAAWESAVSLGAKIVFVAKTQAASSSTPNAKNDTSRRDLRLGFRILSRMTFPPNATVRRPPSTFQPRAARNR